MNRIKYWLLRKLLAQICEKTDCCRNCVIHIACEGYRYCALEDVHEQARKVWGLQWTEEKAIEEWNRRAEDG